MASIFPQEGVLTLPERVALPGDLFSRFYRLKNGQAAAIVYRTMNQAVATLDGDSAEVWRLFFESGGQTAPALAYIAENGRFDADPPNEARAVLLEFLCDMETNRLLGERRARGEIEQINSLRAATNAKENLEQGFAQKMADERLLYSLVLELTYRCNERCVHCYLPDERRLRLLTPAQLEALLDEFRSLGGFTLTLTGGELLTRRDIAEIFALVKARGFLASIVSNLTLMNERLLQAIVSLAPRSVGCSVYAARADLHDAITRLPGSFDKTLNAVRRLREAGIPVTLKTPLMKSTAPHWREIEALARELGCAVQYDLSITAQNDGKLSPLAQRVTDRALIDEIFSSEYYRLSYSGEAVAAMAGPGEEAGLCGAGASGLAVGPGGEIRPCIGLNVPIGNYPGDSLAQIWNGAPFFKEFGALRARDVKECANCRDFAFCSRCPGAWHAEHGSYLRPAEYACFLGHALARAQRQSAQPNISTERR